LEGAEFFTVLPADPDGTQVYVVDRFLTELEHAFKVSELTIKLDLHAGVTLYPQDGIQPETMLRRTDIALDLARQNKQRIHYYEDGEDEAHMQRLAMIESLRQVILAGGNGQLFMMYQPKISLDFQEQPKMEALIRWQRDNKHFVSPELFVNLAEEASLIVDLTYWVFENVMSQLQAWHQKGYLIGAAINVSAQDLAHPEFESFVLSCSEKYQVSPSFITLELTERDIMHDEASVVVSLRSLRQAGFSVAIDDYGIGQSSLSKLKGLPVDEIKLDKSFIMNLQQSPKDQLIVRSTIELAHGLGFLVVAEGVENEASLTLLKQMRCDYIQGYYISRPLAAEAVVPWQRDYVNENNLSPS
jgi:EAL domain-containing protein (putative c-di-GMP-specific phosphodiesterase class I)